MLKIGGKLKLTAKYLLFGGLIIAEQGKSDVDVRPISEAWG